MIPRKNIGYMIEDERCWLKGTSKDTVKRQCVEMCAAEAKSDIDEIHLKPCTLGESQRATNPGSQHTTYARSRVVKSRVPQSSSTCFVYFLFLFPFIDPVCSSEPCVVLFQVITWCSLSFFILHKLIQVVFPSLGSSSCFSLISSIW